jgi:phosphatidylglycerophosphate synthase
MNNPAPASQPPSELSRRPIRARHTNWAQAAARLVARSGLRPNQISVLSVAWALLGAAALVGAGQVNAVGWRANLLLGAGFCVQMRLLCNLLDGMVAVEGGWRTKSGEIYNELPDRISDLLLLTAAGYATRWTGWERELGCAAAALAVFVAYIRAMGGQVGVAPQFCGPMAKQQRMFLLTASCALTILELSFGWTTRSMTCILVLIAVGSVWTALRRAMRILHELEVEP